MVTVKSSESPKVSIVCAWYNRPKNIRATIDSLLFQDFDDYEVVVVNDGSTAPEVRSILNSYSDPKLRVYHQENSGFVNAIKKAISLARAEYIAIQGAGDISLPNRLREQYGYLVDHPDVGAVGSGYYVSSESDRYQHYRPPIQVNTCNDLISGVPFTHGTIMYRKNAYIEAGGYDGRFKYCSDWEFYYRLILKYKISSVTSPLYKKIEFNDGFSFDPDKKLIQFEYSKKARGGKLRRRVVARSRRLSYLLISFNEMYDSARKKEFNRCYKWMKKVPGILTGRCQKEVDKELFWKRGCQC